MRTIVVGRAGESGRDAVALGADLAEATGARLVLAAATARCDAAGTDAVLRALRDELVPDADTTIADDTWPARGLRHAAAKEDADVVVVGSSSLGVPGRVLAGDKAIQLLEDGPCAVLVAPLSPRPACTGPRAGRLRGLA